MRSIKLLFAGFIFALIAVGIFWFSVLRNQQTYKIDTSRAAVVKQLQALSRYETASFTIEKIIEARNTSNKTFKDILFGDKILLIASGEVIAGFDLSKLKEEDVKVEGSKITLNLPKPVILVSKLHEDQTKVYDRTHGLLTQGDKDLESKARSEAEKSIKAAACDGGILDQASKNAKEQLTTLLKTVGFNEVIISIPKGSC